MSSLKSQLRRRLSPQTVRFLSAIKLAAALPAQRIAAMYWKRRHTGQGAHIDRTVQVLGWRQVRVGERTVVSEGSWLNVNQRGGLDVRISIGADSYIGRRNFFSSGRLIAIGPYALTGLDCRFLGSDHLFDDPFTPYIASGTTADGAIVIGANCWLGAGVIVLGAVCIGHGSIIGAGALVNRDAPPFSLVVGRPGRVIKRYDPISRSWIAADRFTSEMAAQLPDEASYLMQLDRTPKVRMPIAAAGRAQGDLP